MKKFTEDKLFEVVLKQFEIAGIEGITSKDLVGNWYTTYQYTQEQNDIWLDYLKVELKPYTSGITLDKTIKGFNLQYGLKIG